MIRMHFHFVCKMNKFSRVLFIYFFILAVSGAELKPKSSTTVTSKEPSSTTIWKPSSTTRWKQPSSTTSWKSPSSTTSWKTPSWSTTKKDAKTTRWEQPTSTTSWKLSTSTKATPTTRIPSRAAGNHGVVAVASISGIDSRNGRLSSMNGIKVYPSDSSMVKTDDKGNFIFKSVDGKMPMPITITKHGDGVSGTIRILPGSVSVSSSASSSSKSGPASAAASYNPWASPNMKPIMNDIYFPPFPTFPSIPDPFFDTRIPDNAYQTRFPDPFPKMRFHESSYQDPWLNKPRQDPWINKASFRSNPARDDIFKTNWFYPTFNPFIQYW